MPRVPPGAIAVLGTERLRLKDRGAWALTDDRALGVCERGSRLFTLDDGARIAELPPADAVATDGACFVLTRRGRAWCVERDGRVRWEADLGPTDAWHRPPSFLDGDVLVDLGDERVRLDGVTGRERGRGRWELPSRVAPGVSVVEGVVHLGDERLRLGHALEAYVTPSGHRLGVRVGSALRLLSLPDGAPLHDPWSPHPALCLAVDGERVIGGTEAGMGEWAPEGRFTPLPHEVLAVGPEGWIGPEGTRPAVEGLRPVRCAAIAGGRRAVHRVERVLHWSGRELTRTEVHAADGTLVCDLGEWDLSALALSADGRWIAACDGGTVLAGDLDGPPDPGVLRDGGLLGPLGVLDDCAHALAIAAPWVVACSDAETVLWSVRDGERWREARGANAVTVAGDRVVRGYWDGSVDVLDAPTGALVARYDAEGGEITAVAVHGDRIFAACADTRIVIWSLADPTHPLRPIPRDPGDGVPG